MSSPSHILVLGLGESGLAMALWLARGDVRLRVADSRAHPPGLAELLDEAPKAERRFGPFQMNLLDGIDLLALSPGLSQNEPVVQEARRRGIKITGEIELFAQALRELGWRDSRIIAITGTNGKTTTTTLAGEMCRAAGKVTAVAGNISPAALTALMACQDLGKRPDVWVLELSSFQLETLETLYPEAATVLNVTDDHLDRHGDMEGYAAAKAEVFQGEGVQVLNRQDERVMAMALPGRQAVSFGLDAPTTAQDFGLAQRDGQTWLVRGEEGLLPLKQLPIAGLHNAANALAALALCAAIGLPLEPLIEALKKFKGLSHRVEWVAELNGVAFYDDSKGTNVGATVAAIEGLGRPLCLIAGGDGKGQDFTPLAAPLSRHGRHVALIGRDASLIEAALAGQVALSRADDMEQAVRQAFAAAQPGDAVLLSPACASMDMYRNYAHRAEVFVAAVNKLANELAHESAGGVRA